MNAAVTRKPALPASCLGAAEYGYVHSWKLPFQLLFERARSHVSVREHEQTWGSSRVQGGAQGE
jgi:hypothetical protein